MPSKRQRLTRRPSSRITPAAIEAFVARDEEALQLALGLKPWQPSPLETDTDRAPAWAGATWRDSWSEVRKLRRALEEAIHAE